MISNHLSVVDINGWMFQVPGNELKKKTYIFKARDFGGDFHRAKKRSENTAPDRASYAANVISIVSPHVAPFDSPAAIRQSSSPYALFLVKGCRLQGLWMKGFFPAPMKRFKKTRRFSDCSSLMLLKGSLEMLDFFYVGPSEAKTGLYSVYRIGSLSTKRFRE